jgi:hypothetical protein
MYNNDGDTTTSRCAILDTYFAWNQAWSTNPYVNSKGWTSNNPYPTFNDFLAAVYPPQMIFNPSSSTFQILADSNAFGTRILPFASSTTLPTGVTSTPPQARLFFNSNMFGMYGNYDNLYWNDLFQIFPDLDLTSASWADLFLYDGYVNEILFTNKFWSNVVDYRLSPYAGISPLGYVPVTPSGGPPPINQQRVYWSAQQDFSSTDSLWSPISSIVFTSTLLPIKSEATGAPVILGQSNIGFSAPTTQSAFQPIITDIAANTATTTGAATYRQFIYYAPTAEYRLSDFSPSKQDIRNIDIQVYWKNRLDNQLYPINMFNLSNVSIKIMFKHKDAHISKGTS